MFHDRRLAKKHDIVRLNDVLSIRPVRMDAPCCKGPTDAAVMAIRRSKKDLPLQITTIFSEGEHAGK